MRSPLGREARIVNMSELGRALTARRRSAGQGAGGLQFQSRRPSRPIRIWCSRGLRRDDLFTVVLEQFQTDTADYADILLPSTTFLEHTDLYSPTAITICNWRVRLCPRPAKRSRMWRFSGCWPNGSASRTPVSAIREDDMIRTLLASDHPFVKGITLEQLDREHSVRLNVSAPDQPYLPFAHGGFGTTSGKCEFHPAELDYTPPVESRLGAAELRAKYPLEMISSKNDDSMNSTFGNRADTDLQTSVLWLHKEDADSVESAAAIPCVCLTIAARCCCAPRWTARFVAAWCGRLRCAGRSLQRTATASTR